LAAKAFSASRLDWVYSLNGSFVDAAKKHGLSKVSLAMNANLPDSDTPGSSATYDVGRVLNAYGQRLTAPWMRAWRVQPFYGCVNNPQYRQIAIRRAATLLKAGADVIQHDDPATNGEAVAWNGGDPRLSGCYCSVCMSGFTNALLGSLNASVLHKLNVTGPSWNYRDDAVLPNASQPLPPPRGSVAFDLRELFVAYQINVTRSYVEDLRSESGNATSFSANNGGRWSSPNDLFDFGLGELDKINANPGGLRNIFVDEVPPGRQQVMTMPKEASISPSDVLLTRAAVAQSYSLGANMLVPWDIYLPTPNASRFFGSQAQFGDLFAFVRAQADLLEAADTSPFYRPATADMNLTHSGSGGDGQRWRLPSDNPASQGRQVTGSSVINAGTCAWSCEADKDCIGMFTNSRQLCWLLYGELQSVENTEMVGESFTRVGGGSSSSVVWCNDSSVDLSLRTASCGTASSAPSWWALHVVSWNLTSAHSGRTSISVSVQNDALCVGQPACGHFTATVSCPASQANRPLSTTSCTDGRTLLTLPPKSVSPWCIVRVDCRSNASNVLPTAAPAYFEQRQSVLIDN
jgi:hypothetical protein